MAITFSNLGAYGRLGNQLFQVAAVISLANRHNDIAVFPEWVCQYTNKKMSNFFKHKIEESININSKSTYYEPCFNYKEIIYVSDLNLHGYFQSEKFFLDCPELIKYYFEPSDVVINSINSKYAELLKTETCSIHVRLGDYVGNKVHTVCDKDYYNRAINYINEITKIENFVVFSDNIQWCKKNFPTEYTFVENGLNATGTGTTHQRNNSDIEELFFMSMCKNNIIANSSYSWWSSWLNKNDNKIIIAPPKWFTPNANIPDVDVYTNNMIKI